MPHQPAAKPFARADRIGWIFLTLLAPFVLAWTSWNFWRLATTGKIWVRDGTTVFETGQGLNFWVSLGLYVVLWLGAVVLLVVAFGSLRRRRRAR